jgi:phosphoribosylformimino-5-aminoimidazole carboxamide ribotide isomerase
MRIVGVIDLKDGSAVHARGGRRGEYRPVTVAAGRRVDGDPEALARAYVDDLGLRELYIADLDAIAAEGSGGTSVSAEDRAAAHARHAPVIAAVARLAPLWLDAGVSSVASATGALERGAARIVVGLETLDSFASLAAISMRLGPERVVFSADLVDGHLLAPRLAGARPPLDVVAKEAVQAGVGAIVVLDLARVGGGNGPDVAAVRRMRAAVETCRLFAGGGVRDADDLQRLADAGCEGALVATALHEGRIGTVDLRRFAQPSVSR